MGFNKRYLPEIDVLKKRLNDIGVEMFLKIYYFNPDAIIGSKESMDFVESIYEANKK